MFAAWRTRGGAGQLVGRADSTGRPVPARPDELSWDEVLPVAEGLEYRGNRITTDDIRAWLAQFRDLAEQRLMLKLLAGVRRYLYTPATFSLALTSLNQIAKESAGRAGCRLEQREVNRTSWIT